MALSRAVRFRLFEFVLRQDVGIAKLCELDQLVGDVGLACLCPAMWCRVSSFVRNVAREERMRSKPRVDLFIGSVADAHRGQFGSMTEDHESALKYLATFPDGKARAVGDRHSGALGDRS
jgi:hypothetical protein